MSTSSNHTKGFCPVLPSQAHGGELANFIVRPRMLHCGRLTIIQRERAFLWEVWLCWGHWGP